MFQKTKPHLLVVGGTGFIGYHLVSNAKKKGWKVTSLSLAHPKQDRHVGGVKYLMADITDLQKIKKKLNQPFTYVVNLGGYVNHSFSKEVRTKIFKTHFVGLINLTKIFSKKKIKKFIQIGSSAEYGLLEAPQREDLICLPKSPYARAKLASSKYLLMLHKIRKFPVTILRFFQVYGPKQDQNRILPIIINGCLNNKIIPLSKGNQIRDFCYIDDVLKAIFLTLVSKETNGEIINIGSGKPTKLKEVIKTIHKKIGKGQLQFGKIKYRKDENMKVYSNIKKARIKLKWQPKTTFSYGIKNVINSFK